MLRSFFVAFHRRHHDLPRLSTAFRTNSLAAYGSDLKQQRFFATGHSASDNNNNNNNQVNHVDADDRDQPLFKYLASKVGIDDRTLYPRILKAMEDVHGRGSITLDHLESLGPSGLQTLAASVQSVGSPTTPTRSSETTSTASTVKKFRHSIPSVPLQIVLPHHYQKNDDPVEITWRAGQKLLKAIQLHCGPDLLEATCGGQASCCTCHVYLKNSTGLPFPPPDENEQDMLDLAFEPLPGVSRLACQVRLTPAVIEELQGRLSTPSPLPSSSPSLIVEIPNSVHNVWDGAT